MSHQLLVLYATETGNSQDVAKRIGREALLYRLSVKVQSLQQYDIVDLPTESFVVFVVATTGQGDVPTKAKTFWKFLFRKSLAADSLSNVNCAVFGLGDSAYLKFNVVAKKLYNRLKTLGATMILEKGLGDDQADEGYEAALDPWLSAFWNKLESQLHLTSPKQMSFEAAPLTLEMIGNGPGLENDVLWFKDSVDSARWFSQLETSEQILESECPTMGFPFYASVVQNERITSEDHFQDTRHISLDISNSDMKFAPGDVLCINPLTPWNAIDDFLTCLNIHKLSRVRIKSVSNQNVFEEFYVRSLVQGVMDVASASPRRFFFEMLSHFSTDSKEKERLGYLASSLGRQELSLYNKQSGRTVLEVLKDFCSSCPPLAWLLDTVPHKVPRKFSISSSLKAYPKEIHLTVAIGCYETKAHRMKHGLCTSYLASLTPQSEDSVVACWIEKGSMKFSSEELSSKPLILIGPGTGIAPFRSLLQERQSVMLKSPSCLFFGCRNQTKDYYYKQEIEGFRDKGILNKEYGLIVAFSRDQKEKVYVTHKIVEKGALLTDLLVNQNASIFISGSAKQMPQNVRDAFVQVLQQHAHFSSDEAQKFLKFLEQTGRYQVESWS